MSCGCRESADGRLRNSEEVKFNNGAFVPTGVFFLFLLFPPRKLVNFAKPFQEKQKVGDWQAH